MSWLTAPEALQLLGVRPQTLYANVSRKKIRAKPDPKDTRRSLYHEADVRKMARQHGGQRKATAVAAAAIEWGEPILSSSVSTVVDGRLYYRGQDAVELSGGGTFEWVADLLWGVEARDDAGQRDGFGWGNVASGHGRGGQRDRGGQHGVARQRGLKERDSVVRGTLGSAVSAASPLQRAFTALGLRAGVDLSSYGRSLPVLQAEAASVLGALANAMLGSEASAQDSGSRGPLAPRAHGHALRKSAARGRMPGNRASRMRSTPKREAATVLTESYPVAVPGLHHRAAAIWRRPDAADVVRRALILLADHELNASTFATRVAVSTGAPLAAGVLSGLATLSGPLHGRASLGVLELVAGVERVGADVTIRDWLSQGRPIAGFGHPLYPLGDQRATALLQHFPLPAAYAQLRDVVEEVIGERPNIDFALAALTNVFDLPREAPLILFALGRCAGWLAHALEQVTTGHPIRPRARYVGPPISKSA